MMAIKIYLTAMMMTAIMLAMHHRIWIGMMRMRVMMRVMARMRVGIELLDNAESPYI